MSQNPLIRLVPDDQLAALIGGFLDDCALQNLTPQTLRFYRTNLERFHWWCVEQEYLDRSPLDRIRAPRMRKESPRSVQR